MTTERDRPKPDALGELVGRLKRHLALARPTGTFIIRVSVNTGGVVGVKVVREAEEPLAQ